MRLEPYPCEEASETAVPRGAVPHFLPGTSPLPGLNPKLADEFGTPYQPRLGGPETMSGGHQEDERHADAGNQGAARLHRARLVAAVARASSLAIIDDR